MIHRPSVGNLVARVTSDDGDPADTGCDTHTLQDELRRLDIVEINLRLWLGLGVAALGGGQGKTSTQQDSTSPT